MLENEENEKDPAQEIMMQEKTEVSYSENIVIDKDDSELNDFLTCWREFNTRPSKLVIYSSFDESLWEVLHKEFEIE
jgi:hypothetical protein